MRDGSDAASWRRPMRTRFSISQTQCPGSRFPRPSQNITTQARAGVLAQNLTPQPWFEDVLPANTVAEVNPVSYSPPATPMASNNTQAAAFNNSYGFVSNGDIGDFTAFNLAPLAPPNVGSSAQFDENTFYTNKGFSTYHALLVTLQKNRSHGLNYDFNYTFQHSIDNISFFANSQGDTGIGGVALICDVVRPRECRGNSDFDIKQVISADASYELPFGKGKMFAGSAPFWVNEVIGGWSLSGITSFHSGQAWGAVSNAFVASFANDAPAILTGPKKLIATHLTKLPGGGVNVFANSGGAAAQYSGPIGFKVGSRNGLRGPNFFDADLGLGKTFPITAERVNLRFRADAFNVAESSELPIPAENGFNGYDQGMLSMAGLGIRPEQFHGVPHWKPQQRRSRARAFTAPGVLSPEARSKLSATVERDRFGGPFLQLLAVASAQPAWREVIQRERLAFFAEGRAALIFFADTVFRRHGAAFFAGF